MTSLKKFTERDFEFFRNGVLSGRLNPVSMGKALFIFPLLSLCTALGAYSASRSVSPNFTEFWFPFFTFQGISSLLLLLLSISFFFKKISLKYQRFQMFILTLSAPQMAFNLSLVFLVKTKMDFSSFPFTIVLISYVIAGFLVFCLSLIRAYRRLKGGEFRENGRGLLGKQYSESLSRFSNIAVFAIIAAFLGAIVVSLFGLVGQDIVTMFVMFVVSVIIYSVGITEFIFVLYCKLRFPSFNITAEQQVKIDKDDKLFLEHINRLEKEEKEAIKRQKHGKRKNSKNFRG
ncbi:hypothetical protein OYT88_15085 [Sporolactobacillus sp. CQH2019]|uniref:hypothetical protein n=1 Tax=Sporolactobacillus sp. CQH2019 TaxID=3023512 RepID=UPI0023688DE7|nr:hypothetical protein [Sporolactobacillus sp. CQH2019]MDD9149876.1 hypothetical protein [Sporolactobacillus sp. CQH2019]